MRPATISIIDNGRNYTALMGAISHTFKGMVWEMKQPATPAGVAESWNWFLGHVDEHRIITNDDIVFAPHTLERMITTPGDIVFAHGFSCFEIRDSCIDKVGTFDETISPGYAYYEDCDYMERIRNACRAGNWVNMANAEGADVIHGEPDGGSCTYRAGTQAEIDEHWRKHHIAHVNFVRKHGADVTELEARWNAWMSARTVAATATPVEARV